MTASVYVHLPFCVRKCRYCDFESYAGRLNDASAYVSQVLAEADALRAREGSFFAPTVYFGGGTPTILPDPLLERLVAGILERVSPGPGAEISMEANPGTVTPEKLRMLKYCGVNRLSFGVQATQDRILAELGRIHTYDDAVRAVEMARDAGFDNLNLDMMFALPGQTAEDLTETAKRFARLGAEHISCYSLILEPGTELERMVGAGEMSVPDEDEACELQELAVDLLEGLGYRRYEISNFARPGRECRHNIVYWQGGEYVGFGCAAHSYLRGKRFCNPGFDEYMQGKRKTDVCPVDLQGRMEEALMLRTRMIRGLDLNAFAREFGAEPASRVRTKAKQLRGLISEENGFLRITRRGYMVHNRLVLELVEAAGDTGDGE